MNDEKLLALGDELIDSVKGVFPNHAEFYSEVNRARDAYKGKIYWKLNNDLNRPHKSSRRIFVVIPEEVIEDCHYETCKNIVQERFKAIIQEKYKSFNPEHNNSEPPTEEWLIASL